IYKEFELIFGSINFPGLCRIGTGVLNHGLSLAGQFPEPVIQALAIGKGAEHENLRGWCGRGVRRKTS
ncbi:MAG: hypothetical protein OEZ19_04100, partial [Paracoccaceae bacterium]|nr:hypothetical protein [Paracoccaceae bacterium]